MRQVARKVAFASGEATSRGGCHPVICQAGFLYHYDHISVDKYLVSATRCSFPLHISHLNR